MRVASTLALVVFLGGGAAVAQEKIDNPTYASWAKHKVGTTTVLKSTTSGAMFSSESTITTKLVEVTADKVVVEMTVKSKAAGKDFDLPPMKQEYPKTIELPKGAKKETFATGKPEGTTKEGTETVKVGGQELKTKWYEYEVKANGMDIKAKMWMSDDVPGAMVKMESKVAAQVAGETKMELIEFKKP
jgi:hypothetical protein